MSNYQQSEDTEQNQDMEDVLETFGLSPEPKKKESIVKMNLVLIKQTRFIVC